MMSDTRQIPINQSARDADKIACQRHTERMRPDVVFVSIDPCPLRCDEEVHIRPGKDAELPHSVEQGLPLGEDLLAFACAEMGDVQVAHPRQGVLKR